MSLVTYRGQPTGSILGCVGVTLFSCQPLTLCIKFNACSINPPSQPWLSLSQSTSSCSDKDHSSPVLILLIPSTETTVDNAQQLPVKSTKFQQLLYISMKYFRYRNLGSSYTFLIVIVISLRIAQHKNWEVNSYRSCLDLWHRWLVLASSNQQMEEDLESSHAWTRSVSWDHVTSCGGWPWSYGSSWSHGWSYLQTC